MSAPHDGRATEFDETLILIRQGRTRAWRAVNVAMIETYKEIGALLSRKFKDQGWGQAEVDGLAKRLAANSAGGIGFGARNLMRMKSFHEIWTKAGRLPPSALALPWECHLVLLEHCTTDRERFLFLDAALQGGWSAQELEARINAGAPRRRRARPTK